MMNEHKTNLPSLTQLTQRLRAANIRLRWDITASGRAVLLANKNIPNSLRHLVWRYSRELFMLHLMGDIRVCRNPTKHRPYWYYLSSKSKMFCCERCYKQGLWNEDEQLLHLNERIVPLQKKEDAIEEVTIVN